jgi:uncharacterized membrane protein YdbT with pleckstrin-like domain
MDTSPNPEQHPLAVPHHPQPAAYDGQGRPLYHAPPQIQQPAPQVVHLSRAVEPIEQIISPEVQKRHAESMRAFPQLNLSEGEYVISAVRRHPIGLVAPVAFTIFFVALVASLMINYKLIASSLGLVNVSVGAAMFIGFLLLLLALIGGYIAVWVYTNNRFFLTNESVIQEIQVSLFSRHEQTVSLQNIEDASYRQQGMLETMFDYGAIRLSTEGDETTYRFNYVSNPKQQIATLNNAVEAFKNGRPVLND